jgi:cyclic dehypoxanthinyl futalosine synthase
MIEENVVSAAGTAHHLTLDQIKNAILELGYEPRQRNVHYQLIDHPLNPTPFRSMGTLPLSLA